MPCIAVLELQGCSPGPRTASKVGGCGGPPSIKPSGLCSRRPPCLLWCTGLCCRHAGLACLHQPMPGAPHAWMSQCRAAPAARSVGTGSTPAGARPDSAQREAGCLTLLCNETCLHVRAQHSSGAAPSGWRACPCPGSRPWTPSWARRWACWWRWIWPTGPPRPASTSTPCCRRAWGAASGSRI